MGGQLQNNQAEWRWASASQIGSSHVHYGERLQDAYVVSAIKSGKVFAAVSDGAGSAIYGSYGAWLTCRHLSVRSREWLNGNSCLPDEETVIGWIDELRARIDNIAKERDVKARQFAATLAALIILDNHALAIQVGDSSIVARNQEQWEVICWPQNGEFASSTYFVTDEPNLKLNISHFESPHNAFALFTDGIADIALSNASRAAHGPFFDPLFKRVDTEPGNGRLIEVSTLLGNFLGGAAVNERTDDDKTLVLLTRK